MPTEPLARRAVAVRKSNVAVANSASGITPVPVNVRRSNLKRFLVACLENRALMLLVSPALALCAWQVLVLVGVISLDSFTSPARVLLALKEVLLGENPALRGSLLSHIWASVQEVFFGFLC